MHNKHARKAAALWMTSMLAISAFAITVSAAEYETDWNEPYVLTGSEFLPAHTESIQGIYICAVPASSDGSFLYGSRVLRAGDVLSADALSQITLQPNAQQDAELTMEYRPIVNDQLGQSAQLTIAVSDGKTEPPKAEDGDFETYKNVANNGKLNVQGGAEGKLTYQLVKEPKRGTVTIAEDGTFLYTPNKNKVGKDSFTYTVTDSAGNTSNEATITVKIAKPTDAAAYADLDGDYDQFEAMWLQTSGLFSGKELAGQLCFEPDAEITRGDFLVMVMKLAGIEPDDAQTTSGFSDENYAPVWMQPYLSAALRCGIVNGTSSQEGLLFRPNEAITCAEASVIIQNVLALPQPETTAVFADDTLIPTWAQSSVQTLSEAGLVLDCSDYTRPLTRREAANVLYDMNQLL